MEKAEKTKPRIRSRTTALCMTHAGMMDTIRKDGVS